MLQLIDDRLGTLDLRGGQYVVAGFEISSRAPRTNIRARALADGQVDDTVFVGGRAITVAIRLNEAKCGPNAAVTMQDLIDRLAPYMSVRRRPTMRWAIPGSGSTRQLTVRGESLPVQVNAPKHLTLIAQFVSDGEITSPEQECVLISPADDTETGRGYDRTYDVTYPTSAAIGDRIINQGGNEPAHWAGQIFGDVTGPYFKINGITVQFDTDYNVPAGSSIIIDTRERTMYLNGSPTDPVYHLTNFAEWTWDALLLQDGENAVRYGADVLGTGTVMQMCWHDTWAG